MTQQLKLKLDAIIKVIETCTMAKVHGNRERQNVDARQIYFKIVHEHLRIPISHTAHYIGKNHATGIHALKQFKNFYETDKELRRMYTNVIDMLERYDLDVDKTDNKDLLDDYVSIMKKNDHLQDKYDDLKENFEHKVTQTLVWELRNLPNQNLRMIVDSGKVNGRVKKLLQNILIDQPLNLDLESVVEYN
jgi:hypothetical protein